MPSQHSAVSSLVSSQYQRARWCKQKISSKIYVQNVKLELKHSQKIIEKGLNVRTKSFINSSDLLTSTCHHQVMYLVCWECQQTQPFRSCPWAWHCFFSWNMTLSYLLAQNHRRCYVSNQTRQRHDTSHNSVHPISDQPEVFFVINRKRGTFCKGTKK